MEKVLFTVSEVFFVPSSGDLFLMMLLNGGKEGIYHFFVPSSGDLFLIKMKKSTFIRLNRMSFFVPSSGDLFLMSLLIATGCKKTIFRPLFWGFVFNDFTISEYDAHDIYFSSPLLGICF